MNQRIAFRFPAPTPSPYGDHDVAPEGTHLAGRRVALLVTGGIAAMKIPFLARALRRQGADVVAFVSEEATRYVTVDALGWSTANPVVERLTAAAEHLSDAAPFDAYLLAPATYNSINKIAAGIADGVVTAATASALGRLERGAARVLVAPTMHGSMHNGILMASLAKLHAMGVEVIPPRDAYGKHNLPDERVLVAAVARALSRSPLCGRRILVTGGTTPVPIDGVRRIVNRFRGRLGIAIAAELHLRGADVMLLHGDGAFPVPSFVPHRVARTYDDYRTMVAEELNSGYEAAVFSAGVADYRPVRAESGKIPSGRASLQLELVPTVKVIEEARAAHPELYLVAFKYQENVSHEALMGIARERLDKYPCIVANRGEEQGAATQRAWLVTRDGPPEPLDGKQHIAARIADQLAASLAGEHAAPARAP